MTFAKKGLTSIVSCLQCIPRVASFIFGGLVGVVATVAVLGPNQPDASTISVQPTITSAHEIRHENQVQPSQEIVNPNSTPVLRASSGHSAKIGSPAPESDARINFAIALEVEDSGERLALLQEVLKTWLVKDHAGALDTIRGIENVALRRDLIQFALTNLADNAPATAVTLLAQMPSIHHDHLWERAYSNWAMKEPAVALAAWEAHKHPAERREALKGVASSLARLDVASAVEWATELENGEEKRQAMHEILGKAFATSPALAAQYVEELAPVDRDGAMSFVDRIAQRWADEDPAEATNWAETLPPEQRDRAWREIAMRNLNREPEAAEALANRIEDDSLRLGIIAEIGRLRMTAGPDEALDWINRLPREQQQSAWSGASVEWARSHPQEAAEFALSGKVDDAVSQQLIESAIPQWSRVDPEAAAAWAVQLSGESAEAALQSVVNEWSGVAPEATLEFLATTFEGSQLEAMTRKAVNRWSHANPAEAATFVSDLEDGTMRDSVTREVAETWMNKDSMAASEWVASLEPGSARDHAVDILIARIEAEDPATAAQWAETIVDPDRRNEVYKRLLNRLQAR